MPTKRPNKITMTDQEFAQTLAALRLWQRTFPNDEGYMRVPGSMVLALGGNALVAQSFEERSTELRGLRATWPSYGPLRLSPTEISPDGKRAMLAALKAEGAEGIVFKRRDGRYVPGRPEKGGDALKHKFTKTASVVVNKHNAKRSVAMEVYGPEAVGALSPIRWHAIGNVTIPPNAAIPPVGAVIEVRYLYGFRGGSLFQPVYLGVRDDQDAGDCTLAQIKFKAEAEGGESENEG